MSLPRARPKFDPEVARTPLHRATHELRARLDEPTLDLDIREATQRHQYTRGDAQREAECGGPTAEVHRDGGEVPPNVGEDDRQVVGVGSQPHEVEQRTRKQTTQEGINLESQDAPAH